MIFCCLGNKSFEWAQLNLRQVCFECSGDRHGTIYNFLSEPRLVAAMKLVYRGGEIRWVRKRYGNLRVEARWIISKIEK